jgi:phospholipid/cholesterol/gamma-HCH transport system substrate-binding protein
MSKELKIGIFVVSILTVSFFLINYLRGEDLFNKEIEIEATYASVEGLVPSAPVYIKGYKAGKVSDVIYDGATGTFKVICSVGKEFLIPEDSHMTIYSVDIMGGKGIRIDLGSSDVHVADGGSLSPAFEAGLMDGLAGSVGPLMDKVTAVLDSLNVTVAGVNRMLSDANQASVSSILARLDETVRNAEGITAAIDGRSEELSAFISNLSQMSDKLTCIADKADTVMTDVAHTVSGLSESDIEGMVSSLNELLDNINDPDGTIGKLFVDNSLYNSLDSLLSDVDGLVRKIQENPKKYIRISVF